MKFALIGTVALLSACAVACAPVTQNAGVVTPSSSAGPRAPESAQELLAALDAELARTVDAPGVLLAAVDVELASAIEAPVVFTNAALVKDRPAKLDSKGEKLSADAAVAKSKSYEDDAPIVRTWGVDPVEGELEPLPPSPYILPEASGPGDYI